MQPIEAGFTNCATLTSAPCIEVELIDADCERYPLNNFTKAMFSPAVHGMGSFELRFCESDLPANFQQCCTGIQVIMEWPEVGIPRQVIYSGRFNAGVGYINTQEDVVVWTGRNLLDVLETTYIAYKSSEPGGLKTNIPAATAVYEFLVENLVTPLANRGDGSTCALTMPGNVTVLPPSADIIANSKDWTGGRSYDTLLDVSTKVGSNNSFAVVGDYDDDCNQVFSFVETFDNSDLVLSECLENVKVTAINSSCNRFNVIHMLGAGEGSARAVVTVCDDSILNGACKKEFRLSRNQEDNLDALQTEGEEFLASQDGRDTLTFRTDWGCDFLPFRDIQLNDIVTLEYGGEEREFQLTEMPFKLAYDVTGIQLVEVSAVFKEYIVT